MGNKVEKAQIVSAMPLTKAVILFTDLSPNLVKPPALSIDQRKPFGWLVYDQEARPVVED